MRAYSSFQIFLPTIRVVMGVLMVLALLVPSAAPLFAQTTQNPATPNSEVVIPTDQEVPVVDEAPISTQPLPFQSPSPSDEELKSLRERYRTELSIYRTDERAYQIAKEQYAKLGTLVSLETAVRSTQKVMNSRILVLRTYLQMIRIALSGTPGIDITEKATTLKEVDAMMVRTQQHQEVLKAAVDRTNLTKAVDDFALFQSEYTSVVYKSLTYIAYGRVQTAYDKTNTVIGEVKANLEERERNGLSLGEKRRAMQEIERNFVGTTEKMKTARQSFLPARNGKAPSFSQGSYSGQVSSLSTIYGELIRTIGFLREVIKT
jgi:hypothetical protein